MIDALPLLLGPEGYQISRSVRLRSSASAYLNRTPSIDGNRKKWTWSGWVKRGTLGAVHHLMGCTSQSGNDGIAALYFQGDQLFTYYDTNTTNPTGAVGPAIYRDPSAWYHIVWAVDAANSIHYVYVNNVLVSTDTSKYPVNYDYAMNRAGYVQRIGTEAWGASNYFDGYLTEVNFIDGQALTPSSFGETNPVTGVWQPKKYTGTYGTNGFYLNFSDNSAATAAAIGKDYSGNGNNWTPNNISVTAGVTYDSMLDVPTQWADGGNGRGNYAVLNPLDIAINTTGDGNLKLTNTSSSYGACRATIAVPTTGKWYWETVVTAQDTTAGSWFGVGMMIQSIALNAFVGTTTGVIFYGDRNDASSVISNGATNVYQGTAINFVTGDVLQCSYDADSGKFWFGKNNLWWDSSVGTTGNPSAGTNQTLTAASNTYFPFIQLRQGAGTNIANINFGQRPFAYTPPSGFKALNTLNLPTPTILKGNQYFDATLYTATGTTPQTITNSAGMQPDLVWTKSRSTVNNNILNDSARGSQYYLYSNLINAENNDATYLTSFNSNGFSLGTGNFANGTSMVGWQWKEGATQGFDIVTGTSTGTTGTLTLAHSLGVAPAMVIAKNRNAADDWYTWHTSLGASSAGNAIRLNTTAAKFTSTGIWGTGFTSSNLLFGQTNWFSASGQGIVAYAFSEVAGFSRFGSYTGNGSADGPFVFCGFRPRWIMVKRTDTSGYYWWIVDTARNTYNALENAVYAQASDAETTGWYTDSLANGFKIRNSGLHMNASGGTYIFAAFCENPFKNALAR